MKNILIVGGTSGLGWALANELVANEQVENIYIIGRTLHNEITNSKIKFFAQNLLVNDSSYFKQFSNIDALFITVGAGRVAKFDNLSEKEVNMEIDINYKIVTKILKQFYSKIQSSE